jgi:iron complex outermembrane recepter protein
LNIQNLNFTGLEAGVRIRGLDLRYTALRGTQDTLPAGYTKYTFNYPTQSAVASWQSDIRRAVVVRTRLGAVNRRARDPYAVWDLNAAFTRGRVHPFLQLSNLTSTSYQEILGVAMPGRSIIGGIEVLWKQR